jgi:hypothetical protein
VKPVIKSIKIKIGSSGLSNFFIPENGVLIVKRITHVQKTINKLIIGERKTNEMIVIAKNPNAFVLTSNLCT